jgi:hypothetical protein
MGHGGLTLRILVDGDVIPYSLIRIASDKLRTSSLQLSSTSSIERAPFATPNATVNIGLLIV